MLEKLKKLPVHTHFGIRTGLMTAGLLILLLSYPSSRDGMNAGAWIGLILTAASILWHILFIRCPHCGSPFRLRGGIPKHCPECGKYIDKFH